MRYTTVTSLNGTNEDNFTKSPCLNGETASSPSLICLLTGLFFLLMSTYICLMLCISLHRFLRRQRKRALSVNTSSILANSNSKLGLSMRFVATFVALLCIVHYLMQVVTLYYDCCPELLHTLRVLIYGVIVALTYVFFWLRQRVLYDAPTMRLFNTKRLRTLSWLSLVLIVTFSTAQVITTIATTHLDKRKWIYIAWLAACICVQAVLMSLFIYPLRKHMKTRKMPAVYDYRERRRSSKKKPKRGLESKEFDCLESGIRDSSIFTVSSSIDPKSRSLSVTRSSIFSSNPLHSAAKRCASCAAIVFLSDIIVASFLVAFRYQEWYSNEAEIAQRMLCSVNVATNAVLIVISFGTWRGILFPSCGRRCRRKTHCFLLKRNFHSKVFKTISSQGK